MNIIEIILIGFSVAMDAFAVSICKGLSIKNVNYKKSFIVALWFGIFQAIMPLIGFCIGQTFESIIIEVDHWISFVLLLLIGIDMILESIKHKDEHLSDDLGFKTMIVLSIATSIDALAVGVAYSCAYGTSNAIVTFLVIGIITFILCFIGTMIGNKLEGKFKSISERVGGIILIILGFKILLEHLNVF